MSRVNYCINNCPQRIFQTSSGHHSSAASKQDQNSVKYVNMCMCFNASLWQWCLLLATPTQLNINTPSPSSLPSSTGQLSLLLVSADRVRRGWGVYEGRGVGVGWSTAEQMQKHLLGLLRTGSFPATPQPCSCPGTSCPDGRTKRTRDLLTVELVEVVLWSLTVWISWHSLNTHHPHHYYSRPNLSQTSHARKCTVHLTTNQSLTHITHNGYMNM